MELQQLRAFLAVSRFHGFTEAAYAMHISQPALSRQISLLEKELGTALFIRGNRKRSLELTPAGQRLYQRAREIVRLADQALAESYNSTELVGDVFIGLGESPGVQTIAETISHFHTQYPAVRFRLYSGNSYSLLERLDTGSLDFGFVIGTDGPDYYNRLAIQHQDMWGVYLRRDDPLASQKSISITEISCHPLIVSEQELNAGTLNAAFSKDLSDLNIVSTYNLIHNSLYLTAAGMGYTIGLAGLQPDVLADTLTFLPLESTSTLNTYLIWRPQNILSPQAQAFLDLMRNQHLLIGGVDSH
ncbi:MAG: LysR family transcriptional regulator [Corynebacterium sp.]|nr:LysR family transcriptional regulator [Corynebacterium sp.]